MKNKMADQADGLRRLMSHRSGRLVTLLGSDWSIDIANVTQNLAAGLMRLGKQVVQLDEHDGFVSKDIQREGMLVLVNAHITEQGVLSPLAIQADHIVVVLQPDALSITRAYACIKRLHHAHGFQRLRVMVTGATDAIEAKRILSNLAQTANHYLGLALEPAGWVRADPFVAQSQRLNVSVVEAFQTSPAAMDFSQIAADLLKWPCPKAKGRKAGPISCRTSSRHVIPELAVS